MRRLATTFLFILFALFPARVALAQEAHAVTEAEMEAMVSERAEAADADREAIRTLLRHPEVRDVAESAGLDLQRAEDAVDVLGAEEVAHLAPRARDLNEALIGGRNVIVISTTTLIIALLILVIVLVA